VRNAEGRDRLLRPVTAFDRFSAGVVT